MGIGCRRQGMHVEILAEKPVGKQIWNTDKKIEGYI
jgi:hypothetical protein